MSNYTGNNKKKLALSLVLIQLFMLLPTLHLKVEAVELNALDNQPVLNEVIEGTVRFGSFNYLGDKGSGTSSDGDERDGVDYVSTFYYSDDYFSRSAVNQNATQKTMEWTDLEDLSMATLSKDFTIASYGSSENTFPTKWARKDKNGKRFLEDCGFSNLFTSAEFNQQTGRDTLGYLFGSKHIKVYDQKSRQNKEFTLVAVGVRGAGYGAEWASNLTIGNNNGAAGQSSNNSLKYRHYGFDHSAQKVLNDLQAYTSGMTGNIKYWVVGYSRAGAVANLVAGDITKNASSYKTSIDDVYGYTFEAAAGALTTEDPNGTIYPNIHNIINVMDAVPRVSTDLFKHGRLGVDYRVPFHGNADSNNTAYYNNMRSVLPMVAKIANIYNKTYSRKENDKYEDPVITDSNPSTYPYNQKLQMKSFGITNFNSGFVENVSSSKIAPTNGWYLDDFLDSFIEKFFSSRAWDARKLKETTIFGIHTGWNAEDMKRNEHANHEYEYVRYYQEAFRTLAYEALKNPGMGISVLDGMMDKAMSSLNFGDLLTGAGILVSYGVMNTSNGGLGYESSVGDMISPMGNLVNSIVDGVGIFDDTSLNSVHAAIRTIVPVLTWLYCDDHTFSNGEYLGTVFANVNNILVTHIPEMGVSWLMSLDDVFISDYREITLPKKTAVSMYVFRPGIDDEFIKANDDVESNADAKGQLVSSIVDGMVTSSKDDRITAAVSGDNVTIRYPGNLDLRLDVTPMKSKEFDDVELIVADYAPVNVVNVKSDCERASEDSTNYNVSNIQDAWVVKDDVADHSSYSMTTPDNTPDAEAINRLSNNTDVPMTDAETLHIMTWHGSNQVGKKADTTYDISLDRAPKTVIADYSTKTVIEENASKIPNNSDGFSLVDEKLVWTAPVSNMAGGNSLESATVLGGTYSIVSETRASESNIKTRQAQTVIPASSIYYDDELSGGDASAYTGATTRIDWNDDTGESAGKTIWYQFKGTRIDAYCTTDADNGYVLAAITDESGDIVTIDGERKTTTIKGQSENPRYNVPTISFDGLDANETYYLKIYALKNADYTLDGIRVYHSADETDAAVRNAYESFGEQNAKYVNLRKLLLNCVAEDTLSGNVEDGALFYTDSGTSYALTSSEYRTNSPKNEIYLKAGEKVAFQILGSYEKVEIGMSAPDSKRDGGTVRVTNGNTTKNLPVKNALDSYYRITPSADGNVVIENSGSAMISVTNIKLSGTYTPPASNMPSAISAGPIRVTRSLMRYAADFNALPEDMDDTVSDGEPSAPDEPEETAVPAVTTEPEATASPEIAPRPNPISKARVLISRITGILKRLLNI